MIASPQDQPNGDVFVAKITAVESTGYGGIFAHGFQEQRHDPLGRGYVDMEVGRTGTTTVTPALGINGESYAVGSYVYVRLRGWADLAFNSPSDPASSGLVYDIVAVPGKGGGSFAGAQRQLIAQAGAPSPVTAVIPFDPAGSGFATAGFTTNFAAGTITVATTGYYEVGFSADIFWNTITSDLNLRVYFLQAGFGMASQSVYVPNGSAASVLFLAASTVVPITAGNPVSATLITSGGANVGCNGNGFFWVWKVG